MLHGLRSDKCAHISCSVFLFAVNALTTMETSTFPLKMALRFIVAGVVKGVKFFAVQNAPRLFVR